MLIISMNEDLDINKRLVCLLYFLQQSGIQTEQTGKKKYLFDGKL